VLRSLRSRVMAGYAALVLIASMSGIWAIWNLTSVSGVLGTVLAENYRSVVAAENMIEELERHDSAALMALTGDLAESDRMLSYHAPEFAKWLGRAQDNITISQERVYTDSIGKRYIDYRTRLTAMRDALKNGQIVEANRLYREATPVFEAIRTDCRNLLEVNQTAMFQANTSASQEAKTAVVSTLALSFAGLIAGFVLSLRVSRVITEPVRQLTAYVSRIADGDLEQPVMVANATGEIKDLSLQVDVMRQRLYDYDRTNIAKIIAEQQRIEAIMRSIHEPIFVTDKKFHLVLVNPAAERAFGIQERDALAKHMLESIKNNQLFELVRSAVESGDSNPSTSTLTLPYGESTRIYDVEVELVASDLDEHEGAVVVLKDVTHFRELDEVKSKFVSMVSHEFRTPLTSITLAAGLLIEDKPFKDGSDNAQLLAAIKEDSDRLSSLVTDLLDFTRMESGKISLVQAPVTVRAIAEAATRGMQPQIESRGITVDIDIEDSLPAVFADANKITWVISNLVSNALRYTDPGGRIRVSARFEGRVVVVSCEDSGIGIPADQLLRIFEPFVQLPGTVKRPAGGAGLGLAICKEIVEAHGGRIWAESTLGKGSVFRFSLPVAKVGGVKE
jgi:two-component system, NtrC family, sensor histidine kinase KinB